MTANGTFLNEWLARVENVNVPKYALICIYLVLEDSESNLLSDIIVNRNFFELVGLLR